MAQIQDSPSGEFKHRIITFRCGYFSQLHKCTEKSVVNISRHLFFQLEEGDYLLSNPSPQTLSVTYLFPVDSCQLKLILRKSYFSNGEYHDDNDIIYIVCLCYSPFN